MVNRCTDLLAHLAAAQLLFLLFTVPSTLLYLGNDVFCSTLVPPIYLSLLFQLSLFSYQTELFWLVFICIESSYSFSKGNARWFACPCISSPPSSLLHPWSCPLQSYTLWPFFAPSRRNLLCSNTSSSSLHSFPISFSNIMRHLGYTAVSSRVLFLLPCIQSSTKPFIYFWVVCVRKPSGQDTTPCPCDSSSRVFFQSQLCEKLKVNAASTNDATKDAAVRAC
ncbi:uncharacterized protein LOC134045008 [Cinclus cinclus]|uniref:uncharacterized protein LOC134045008 n=1 Tax=Cinclus cinclus TaxID=127875 RepID=UPI002E162F22